MEAPDSALLQLTVDIWNVHTYTCVVLDPKPAANFRRIAATVLAFMFVWAVLPSSAAGSGRNGLKVSVYNFADLTPEEWPELRPWRSRSGGSLCDRTTVDAVDHDWGGGAVLGCQADDVALNYIGFIRVPRTGTYTFSTESDDGFLLTIGRETVIDDWEEQSVLTYNASGAIRLRAGMKYRFEIWYYENGGVAASKLYVSRNEGAVQLLPSAWLFER